VKEKRTEGDLLRKGKKRGEEELKGEFERLRIRQASQAGDGEQS